MFSENAKFLLLCPIGWDLAEGWVEGPFVHLLKSYYGEQMWREHKMALSIPKYCCEVDKNTTFTINIKLSTKLAIGLYEITQQVITWCCFYHSINTNQWLELTLDLYSFLMVSKMSFAQIKCIKGIFTYRRFNSGNEKWSLKILIYWGLGNLLWLCHDPVDGQYCQFYSAMPMLIHFSQVFFVEYFWLAAGGAMENYTLKSTNNLQITVYSLVAILTS